jgi:hypothetical protein
VKFESIREAIPSSRKRDSLFVSYDSFYNPNCFATFRPSQIVNRIANMHLLFHKVSFTYLMNQLSRRFIHSIRARSMSCGLGFFIVKADAGSLGQGIAFVEPV